MTSTTVQLAMLALTFLLMAGLGVVLLIVTIKVSPRATQRDVRLRRPGKRTRGGMYFVAALHILTGIVIAVNMPSAAVSIMVVCVASACIYALMAESYALMARTGSLRVDSLHDHHGE